MRESCFTKKPKKKLAIILASVGAGIYFGIMRFSADVNDTEELYRQNVKLVSYDNTVETAYPQTDLYNIIDGHFRSELPEGKTEKKAIVLGYDGCRADILAELKAENSAIATPVKPFKVENSQFDGKTLTVDLKPLSWNVIRLAKRK